MLTFSANVGAVGYRKIISISGTHGQLPINANTTILNFDGGAIANGIDLSASTISGSAYRSPGFTVAGNGVVTAPQFLRETAARLAAETRRADAAEARVTNAGPAAPAEPAK